MLGEIQTAAPLIPPSPLAPFLTATVHPSSILRAPADEARRTETTRFIEDLKKIRAAIG